MIWEEKFNSQQREFENTTWTIKSYLIDRANHEFYKSRFKQIMTSKQLLKWNLRFGEHPISSKILFQMNLENIKDSLIIMVIEEGTPKYIYDHNYKDL